MKFACDKCHTKYSIGDERVVGRVLKIRCKNCNHTISVSEKGVQAGAPAIPVAAAKPAPAKATAPAIPAAAKAAVTKPIAKSAPRPGRDALDEQLDNALGSGFDSDQTSISSLETLLAAGDWFVSFDGEQEGPLTLDRARDRIRKELPGGKEVHAWKDGFGDWLPINKVPEFAALARSKQPPPKPAMPPIPAAASTRPSVSAAKAAVPSPTAKPSIPAAPAIPSSIATVPSAPAIPSTISTSPSAPVIAAAAPVATATPSQTTAPAPLIDPEPSPPLSSGTGSHRALSRRDQAGQPITRDPTGPRAALEAVPSAKAGTGSHAVVTTGSGARPVPTGSGARPIPTGSGVRPIPTGSGVRPIPTGSGVRPIPTESRSRPTPTPIPGGSGPKAIPTGSGPKAIPIGSGPKPIPTGSGPKPIPTGPQPIPTGSNPTPSQVEQLSQSGRSSGSQARAALPVDESTPIPGSLETRPVALDEMVIDDEPSDDAGSDVPPPLGDVHSEELTIAAAAPAPAPTNGFHTPAVVQPAALALSAPVAAMRPIQTPSAAVGPWKLIAGTGVTVIAILIGIIVHLLNRPPTVIFKPEEVKIVKTTPSRSDDNDQPINVPVPGPGPGAAEAPKPNAIVASAPTKESKRSAAPKSIVASAPKSSSAPRPAASAPKSTAVAARPAAANDDEPAEHSVAAAAPVQHAHQDITQQQMAAVVTQNKKSLNICYDRMLKLGNSTPKRGKIVSFVKVGISGRVVQVQIKESSTNPDLDKCFADMMKRWSFPSNGEDYGFEFPIILQAN